MKVYHLGLIILGFIIIFTIISSYKDISVNAYNNIETLTTDIEQIKKNRKERVIKSAQVWQHRLYPRMKGTDGRDMKMLVKEGFKGGELKQENPTAEAVNNEVQNNIQQCQLINTAGDCTLLATNDCGYCVSTDTIAAGDGKKPFVHACITSKWKSGEPEDGEWLGPNMKDSKGRGVDYYCQKKKEQKICASMPQNCGGGGTKDGVKCAWCPATGKQIPAKQGPNGGLIPKYEDDACKWVDEFKNKKYPTSNTKFLGWSPNKGGYPKRGKMGSDGIMTPANKPYGAPLDTGEGDCDRDEDCGFNKAGEPLKCGHDGRNLKRIVGPDGKELKPNAGYKDYCYDPNQWPFKGSLIEPGDCERFGQMFPCVSKNMNTGPHSDKCLQDLWQNASCTTKFSNSDVGPVQKTRWNSSGYKNTQNSMNTLSNDALTSKIYKKANEEHKKCYGTSLNPCDKVRNFSPRPEECSQQLYNSTGCNKEGKLNPKNISGTTPYVTNTWIQGQKGGWSQDQYKNELLKLKRETRAGIINPDMSNFDDTVDSSLKCFGNKPNIPFDKPCWKDFSLIMKCVNGVKLIGTNSDDKSLSFDGAANLQSLLAEGDKTYWKNNFNWVNGGKFGRFLITKELYEKKYFPFWNFIKVSKDYWKNNWTGFGNRLIKSRHISRGIEKVKAQWYGWTPKNKYPLKKGEGDCDSDANCAPGLKCHQNPSSLPGIDNNNVMHSGRDFCYDPLDEELEKGNMLKFTQSSSMKSYIGISNNKEQAEKEGKFFLKNNDLYLTKKAFDTQNFPYWSFLHAADMFGY